MGGNAHLWTLYRDCGQAVHGGRDGTGTSLNLTLPRGTRERGAGMRRVRGLLRGARELVEEVG